MQSYFISEDIGTKQTTVYLPVRTIISYKGDEIDLGEQRENFQFRQDDYSWHGYVPNRYTHINTNEVIFSLKQKHNIGAVEYMMYRHDKNYMYLNHALFIKGLLHSVTFYVELDVFRKTKIERLEKLFK